MQELLAVVLVAIHARRCWIGAWEGNCKYRRALVGDQYWIQSVAKSRLLGIQVLPAEALSGGESREVTLTKASGRKQGTEREVQGSDRIMLVGGD